MRRHHKLNIPATAIMELIFRIALDSEHDIASYELAIGEPDDNEITLLGRTVKISNDPRSEQEIRVEFSVYDANGHLEPVEEVIHMDYKLTDLIAFCAGLSHKLEILANLDWREDNKN